MSLISLSTRRAIKRGFAIGYRAISPKRRGTRVLMYHSIGAGPLSLPPRSFEEQLKAALDEYGIVDPRTFDRDASKSDASVLVTLDDGYLDNYEVAAPILRRLGIAAVFLPVTGLLHGQYQTSRAREFGLYENTPLMTWEHVRELHREGMVIGSHTHLHADFAKSSQARVERQVRLSIEALRAELGIQSALFAYPFGRAVQLTEASRRALRANGIKTAFSTLWGPVTERSDRLALPRIRIDPLDTMADFRAKLDGAWDFIRWAHGSYRRD